MSGTNQIHSHNENNIKKKNKSRLVIQYLSQEVKRTLAILLIINIIKLNIKYYKKENICFLTFYEIYDKNQEIMPDSIVLFLIN